MAAKGSAVHTKRTILLLSALVSLLFSCTGGDTGRYDYRPPENIDDGFQTGTLEDVRIDPAPLIEAVTAIRRGEYSGIHSILIYRDGRLVLEEYFRGHKFEYEKEAHHGELVTFDRDTPHRVMSVTKSIVSACVGIAVDKGFISSVDQSIFDYLPDHQKFRTGGKEKLTIGHLVTMRSGLAWNEWAIPYADPNNDVIRSYFAEDPVAFYLGKSLDFEPGTSFNYSGGCNNLLGEIIRHASKKDLDEFSGEYLFGPLGIDPYLWTAYRNGMIDAAGSVSITPRDMAKIGVTFLNGGVWNGERIISAEWVEKSAATYPGNSWMNDWDDYTGMKGYSYMWWTHSFVDSSRKVDIYYAAGWGGQYIMVIPSLKAVVVFTGGNYTTRRPNFDILKKYIVPAFG